MKSYPLSIRQLFFTKLSHVSGLFLERHFTADFVGDFVSDDLVPEGFLKRVQFVTCVWGNKNRICLVGSLILLVMPILCNPKSDCATRIP